MKRQLEDAIQRKDKEDMKNLFTCISELYDYWMVDAEGVRTADAPAA